MRGLRDVVSLTRPGQRLYPLLERLWGSPNKFYRDGGSVGHRTTQGLLSDPEFYPSIDQLRLVARAIAEKQREIGEEPTPEEEIVGWWTGKTREDMQTTAPVPRRRLCRICGRPMPRDAKRTCSRNCDSLRIILARGCPLAGNKYVFTIMTLATHPDLAPDRIAVLVKAPPRIIEEWASRPRVRVLASTIKAKRERVPRKKRSPGLTLLDATCEILGIDVNALERHLHHTYAPWARKKLRSHAPHYARHPELWQALGLRNEGEYLEMFGFKGVFADLARANARKGQRVRLVRYGYKSIGPLPTDCSFWDNVLRQLDHDVYGPDAVHEEWRAIQRNLLKHAVNGDPKSTWESRELRRHLIRHARECPRHRPRVAVYLARVEETTPDKIHDLLHVPLSTIYRMLKDADQRDPLDFRLTSGEVAEQKGWHRRTVTKRAARGTVEHVHTSGRWWAFPRRVLSELRS